MIGNFTVSRTENPIKVIGSYSSGIQFTFGVNNSIADVTFQLDEDYKGMTKGIMGKLNTNWNDFAVTQS